MVRLFEVSSPPLGSRGVPRPFGMRVVCTFGATGGALHGFLMVRYDGV